MNLRKELKRRIHCQQEEAKTLLKQRLDFLFLNGFETTDTLLTVQDKTIVEKNSLITHLRKEFKKRIDYLQTKIRNC